MRASRSGIEAFLLSRDIFRAVDASAVCVQMPDGADGCATDNKRWDEVAILHASSLLRQCLDSQFILAEELGIGMIQNSTLRTEFGQVLMFVARHASDSRRVTAWIFLRESSSTSGAVLAVENVLAERGFHLDKPLR